jgi:hypothetical protein
MASFKSVRDLLLIGFDEDLLDEEEFLLLYQQYTSLNAEYPYTSYPAFDLELKDEFECKTEFRVEKNDIPGLADTLRIPENVTKGQFVDEKKPCAFCSRGLPILAGILT